MDVSTAVVIIIIVDDPDPHPDPRSLPVFGFVSGWSDCLVTVSSETGRLTFREEGNPQKKEAKS